MIPVSYNMRSLFARRSTTIATVAGIALVVFVLAAAQMLVHGIRGTMARSGRADRVLVLRAGADAELRSNFDSELLNVVLSAPSVRRDSSGRPLGVGEILIVLALEKPGSHGQIANATLRGVPADVSTFRHELRIVDGRAALPGADEVVIGKRLVGQFEGLTLGGHFDLKKNRTVTVVGVFEADRSSHESEILGDIELVRGAFGRAGLVSSATIQLDSPASFTAFQSAIERDKRLGLAAISEPAYYEKQSEGTATLVQFLSTAIVVFFSLGATIGATITMYAAVSNRKREIGTLRALGFSPFTVLCAFVLESIVLCVVGGAIGAVASLAMRYAHFSMMNMNSWSDITFSFEPSPRVLFIAVSAAGFMGLFGGFLPALRAARTSPLAALRED